MNYFDKVNAKQSFPDLELDTLESWKQNNIFYKSIEERSDDKEKIFYDGPPFATGLPHYGHLLCGTIKDVMPRYHTMRGYKVKRQIGWDCHGLPVEFEVEKQLNLNGRNDIVDNYGVAEFSEKCRSVVLKYTDEWEETVLRTGRFVDFKNDYKTMDPNFMESIWWVFGELWKKGLIQKGHKSMHVCPRCVTPLSNFEVTQGYIDVLDWSVVWQFPLVSEENTFLLVWTTTPWSTPGTVAIAIGKDHDYVKVKYNEKFFILVKERIEFVFKGIDESEYQIIEEFKGEKLIGETYKPLIESYKQIPDIKNNQGAYKLHATDYVEISEGTGLVTINGAYGEIDMEATKTLNLPIVMDVEMDGKYNSLNPDYAGRYIKDAELDLLKDMEEKGFVFKREKYKHSYPHCWRCDSPLMNYATSSWFVKIDPIKEKMIANNQKVNWVPSHVGQGRFAEWLNNARDWCISRNRFWGTPLPVWIAEDDSDMICISSIKELEDLSGEKVEDIHKHKIDHIVIEKNGKKYYRTEEVLDCWFESGAMPYAQYHYPFENKEAFDKNFPAEFIAEGLDQTRGWFYTLTVLGNALFDKSPFKNVIVNGLILAEDGKKMSKRLKNYPEPSLVMQKYGADALRFYLLNSPVVKAEPLRFSEKGVDEVLKQVILPLWNSYSFFVTYANIDNFKPSGLPEKLDNELDQWVLAELQHLLSNITEELDSYDLQKACAPVAKYIDSLTNWYIRLSRRRFWKSESDSDKAQAYETLYYVLVNLSKILAPFMPFVSDAIYKNLTKDLSVHLSTWPAVNNSFINEELVEKNEILQKIVSLALSVRARNKVKIRQPLQKLSLYLASNVKLSETDIALICDELNVKELQFVDSYNQFANLNLLLNSRKLGKLYPEKMKDLIMASKKGDYTLNEDSLEICGLTLTGDDFEMRFEGNNADDVAADSKVVLKLDLTINEALKQEGYVRDIIRFIQENRKTVDYKVDQKIKTMIYTNSNELLGSIKTFESLIKTETLSLELEVHPLNQDEKPLSIDDFTLLIQTVPL